MRLVEKLFTNGKGQRPPETMDAQVKRLFPVPPASNTGVDHAELERRLKEERRLIAKATELNERVRELQTIKAAVEPVKQTLVALKEKRLDAESTALINGTTVDVTALTKEIASAETELARLTPKSQVAERALVTVLKQFTDNQAQLASIRTEVIRTRMMILENQLADFAPEFRQALENYKDAVIKMAALALARDRISPQVPGSNGIGADGLAAVTVYVPQMRAFEGLGGTHRLDGPAVAQAREILRKIGMPA